MIDVGQIKISAAQTRLFHQEVVDYDGYVLRLVGVFTTPKWSCYKKSSVASRSTRDWGSPPVRWNGGVLPAGDGGSLALYRCEGRYFVRLPIDGYSVPWPNPELELIPVSIYAGTEAAPAGDEDAISLVARVMANAIEYVDGPNKTVVESETHLRFRWQHNDFELIKEAYDDGSVAARLVWQLMSTRKTIGGPIKFNQDRHIMDLWASELKSGDDVMACFGVAEILRPAKAPDMASRVRYKEPVLPGPVGWRWGQLLAIINAVTPIDPDVLHDVVHQPGKWFGPLMAKAEPLIPKRLRQGLRYVGDSVLDVTDWPKRLAGSDAANAWSGMYWFKREYFD